MSEPIPESIPTSAAPHQRPSKRRALTPRDAQASHLSSLFAAPSKALLPTDTSSSNLSAPPEIVANVQGSSAGAGSGEFHVYKASRRREYERLRAMDEEVKREGEEKEFLTRKEEMEKRDREKTERNRAKRAKALARKQGKGKGGAAPGEGGAGVKRKLVPSANAVKTGEEGEGKKEGEGEAELVAQEEKGLIIEDDE